MTTPKPVNYLKCRWFSSLCKNGTKILGILSAILIAIRYQPINRFQSKFAKVHIHFKIRASPQNRDVMKDENLKFTEPTFVIFQDALRHLQQLSFRIRPSAKNPARYFVNIGPLAN